MGRGDPPTPTPHPAPSIRPPSINTHTDTDTDTHLLRLGRHLMRLLLQPLPRLAPHSFSVTTIRWAGRVGVNVDAVYAPPDSFGSTKRRDERAGLLRSPASCLVARCVCYQSSVQERDESAPLDVDPTNPLLRTGTPRQQAKQQQNGTPTRGFSDSSDGRRSQEGGTRAPQSITLS